MMVFQHPLWGYELAVPDEWVHQTSQGMEAFAPTAEALQQSKGSQILIRAEWNCARQPIEPLWTQHIGKLAGMLGAKQVSSAIWQMAGARGLEAEIVLPKKEGQRLWAGLLAHGLTVLKFAVTHPLEDRSWFEPIATQVISSLRFLARVDGVALSPEGFPLPPGYSPVDPRQVIADINDPVPWRAYEGESEIGALQAFYLREAPNYDWQVKEYVPFPSSADIGFARLQLEKGEQKAVLGIMPYGEERVSLSSPARLAVKYG